MGTFTSSTPLSRHAQNRTFRVNYPLHTHPQRAHVPIWALFPRRSLPRLSPQGPYLSDKLCRQQHHPINLTLYLLLVRDPPSIMHNDELSELESSWLDLGPSDSWESGRSSPKHRPLEPPAEYTHFTERVSDTFNKFADIFHRSRQALPLETGDGTYVTDADDDREGILATLAHVDRHSIGTLKDLLELELTQEPWDDRKYLLEDMIEVWPPSYPAPGLH